jgi:hypothetical protein
MHKYKTNEQRNAIEAVYQEYFESTGDHTAAAVLTLVQYLDELCGALTFHVTARKKDHQNKP